MITLEFKRDALDVSVTWPVSAAADCAALLRGLAVIRIDALWLYAAPIDTRSGTERLLAHVVHALGSVHAHHGYLFANARATRIKMLVHDGFGV